MKTFAFCFLIAAPLVVAACDKAKAGPQPDVIAGFDTPESVLHDVAADVYLISNINGAPTEKDNNGYISRMQPGGTVERRWIEGGKNGVTLHAPKGLSIGGTVLYVADIDTVRMFDCKTGAPKGEHRIAGATFVNDVAAAPRGEVWVTDSGLLPDFSPSGTAAIHVIGQDGNVRQVARGTEIGLPNGIVARELGAYFVTWDTGAFLQVDAKGRVTELVRAGKAKLDGLVRVDDGRWLCTSWEGSCIYEFTAQGGVRALPGLELDQPADLGYDKQRGRIMVPLFGTGEVVLRKL